MKKILILIILVLLGLLAFMFNDGKHRDKLLQYQEQKINSLEHDLADLRSMDIHNENDLQEIELDEEDLMTVSFAVVTDDTYPGEFAFAKVGVPKTSAILTASYEALFDAPTQIMLDDARQASSIVSQVEIEFESVDIDESDAEIYLTGEYTGMHMGDYFFREQINRTAFQFNTVDAVHVYLNGQLFDWCSVDLSDGEGPCADGPQYWIDTK